MTAPWQAMPDFVDGTVVDEGDLDPIVFNLNLVRRSGRILAGRILSTSGVQYTTSGNTELNMPKLQISNITIEANRPYVFGMTIYNQHSVAGSSAFFRIRQNTALTGAQLVLGAAIVPTSGRDNNFTILLPWKPAAGGVMSFFTSVQVPSPLTGVVTVYGSLTTAVWLEKAGDDGTEWALVP
jgi:hypothetical protein